MKNFNEIYDEILEKYGKQLENKRKIDFKGIMFITTFIFVTIILFNQIHNYATKYIVGHLLLLLIMIIIWLVLTKKRKIINEKRMEYKQNVIRMLIEGYNDKLQYKPYKGVSPELYKEGFNEFFNEYHTEDLILGLNEKYKVIMAEVDAKRETCNGESRGFHGLFAKVEFNKIINTSISIERGISLEANNFKSKAKIEMDSSEFEKYFDVYTGNKIITMQILTADTMELLVDFTKKSKIRPEIIIKNNALYIRFGTSEIFEPQMFKDFLDYDTLKKYYDTIKFTFDISKKLIKNIEETEI